MTDSSSSASQCDASKKTLAHKRRGRGLLTGTCLARLHKLKAAKPNLAKKTFPFLKLPGELRNIIYRFTLQHYRPIEIQARYHYGYHRLARKARIAPYTTVSTNLLLACHQINAEATPILYGCNSFNLVGSYGGGCAMILLDFLTDIDRSIQYLRRINLSHVHNMATTISALHRLKQAKNFERLEFKHFDCLKYGSKHNRVAMLLPWLRSLHQACAQSGRSFSLQDVLKVEIDANLTQSFFESDAEFKDRRMLARTWYDEQMGMLELAL
ncbi:hypothetical protein LTR78_002909 [Recurvomyces mirabilis]|uniref:2EXR domain-containing protein n=1 Tax=Recurvomyces mirabilis TaxID=574656 RepID=A0AAE0WSR0_9PEZI|nr:hypothetical protein LTR78_002909 [Recurvomyces mirabilis]KAK5159357.1 hypothetical protein LTS14_002499 [Recurvomyces mirabilis]